MTSVIDVAIIGAGPYGLSIAAHLRGCGVEHRIFGEPMATWQNNMPPGMHLKSDGSSSDLSDPAGALPLAAFCRANGIPHDPRLIPITLETFVSYGLAFQARFAQVEAKRLVALNSDGRGHQLQFDDGETVLAQHVVFAIGVLPFQYVPANFRDLPPELASHSSAYGSLERFNGRDVTVIGAGSSAIDLAALLQEQGARTTLVARRRELVFHGSPHQKASLAGHLLHYRPPSKIGAGWILRLCDDAPHVIHMLPEQWRLALMRRTLGPSGGYFIKDRVVGHVALRCGRAIERVDCAGGRVRLATVAPDGARETIESDHLIMATGYKVDLSRLDFLDSGVLARLQMVEGTPVLSQNYESSVPGLYFVGLAAANSFGPVMRFVAGTPHPARHVSRHLSKSLVRHSVSVPAIAAAE